MAFDPGRGDSLQVILDDDGFSRNFEVHYSVEGNTYIGTRVTFSEYALFANRFQNEQFVNAHPIGSRVRVLYNPNNPASSVLMRTIPLSQAWSPLLLVLCLGGRLFLAGSAVAMGRASAGAERLGRRKLVGYHE